MDCQHQVSALTLNRLGEREIGAMIDRVTGNVPLPVVIKRDIVERTDGIPLFVEEITKAVLEAGGEGAGARSRHSPTVVGTRSGKPSRLIDGAA